ncbi:MAG TPA: hypothetical protein VMW41_00655 [Candidatus Bathyarchaeia archaeon]|nr:hypothetical protein [Candidatus Bathyarchaeia archaeon]
MNKKRTITLSIILFIFVLIFASFNGLPVSSRIEEHGCIASYHKYLFSRTLCQYVTFGHCITTDFNKYNAEMEIARCLCDKYLAGPSIDLEDKIRSKCDSVEPNCDSSIEKIKIDFCNEKGFNSVECSEHFSKNTMPKVKFICQNKDEVFYRIFIE